MRTVTLFCLPCSGSSAATYLRWRRALPKWISVEPVELPGRGSLASEPLLRNLDHLTDRVARSIGGRLTRDYAVFGHSLGGLLAYESVHRLLEQGWHSPCALIIACSPAPTCRSYERFAQLDSDEALIEELRAHNGTPKEVFENPEMLRYTLDVLAADFAACATFRAKCHPTLDIPIHVYGGIEDDVLESDLQAWELETKAGITLSMFEGGHFFFKEKEGGFLSVLTNLLAGLTSTGCLDAHS